MVNKVLKDIYMRYKLLAGYQVNYIPGWDCHGNYDLTELIYFQLILNDSNGK